MGPDNGPSAWRAGDERVAWGTTNPNEERPGDFEGATFWCQELWSLWYNMLFPCRSEAQSGQEKAIHSAGLYVWALTWTDPHIFLGLSTAKQVLPKEGSKTQP